MHNTDQMDFRSKLERLIASYLNEPDKKNIARISIDLPKHRGQFFITDAAKFNLEKPYDDFALLVYFSFNADTKQGQKRKEKIAGHPVLATFFQRCVGKNSLGYGLETGNEETTTAKIVETVIQALFPDVNPATISAEIKRVTWYRLED